MSLNFTKLPYVDGETVIPARNLNEIQDAILDLDDNKVEKEPGKGLSTNDYSNTDKSKVDTALQATTSTTLGPAPIVTFDASAADMPLKGLMVGIEPVQDLHGYDNPWPAGGGKNLAHFDLDEIKAATGGTWTNNVRVFRGITFTVNRDAAGNCISVTVSGTAEGLSYLLIPAPCPGNCILSGCPSGGSIDSYYMAYVNDQTSIASDIGSGVQVSSEYPNGIIYIYVKKDTTVNNIIFTPRLILATESDQAFSPYSNICPISGWTGCNVINGHLPEISWTENKAINASGTIIDSASNGKYSSLIPYANTVVFDVLMAKNASCRVHGYDANGDWVEQLTVFGVTTSTSLGQHVITNIANESIKYIRISLGNASYVSLEYVGTIYPITFPTEAGTVYGGTLDATNKKLTVTHAYYNMENLAWFDSSTSSDARFRSPAIQNLKNANARSLKIVCTCYASNVGGNAFDDKTIYQANSYLYVVDNDYANNISGFVASLAGQYCIYPLATPIIYDLSDIPEITTLHGTNNIWADCGDVTVSYGAYLGAIKAHADRLGDSILSAIAPLETSYTASRAYAVGAFLFVGSKFYKVISAIADGGTITPGTNAVQTTVAEQLMELAAG